MVIADTGFFLALANRRDQHHEVANQVIQTLRDPLVTTWPVMTETCHLLATRVGHVSLTRFLAAAHQGAFQVFTLRIDHLPQITTLMNKYRDLPMDLADASLVVLAGELGSGKILSTDTRDFRTYRWKNRHPFTNLLAV
jgi:predicted nucleic acid-binding protein